MELLGTAAGIFLLLGCCRVRRLLLAFHSTCLFRRLSFGLGYLRHLGMSGILWLMGLRSTLQRSISHHLLS